MVAYTLARADHSDIDHRSAAAGLPRNHKRECDGADDRECDDESRREPVIDQATVEHDLKRAKKGGNQYEADQIEAAFLQ